MELILDRYAELLLLDRCDLAEGTRFAHFGPPHKVSFVARRHEKLEWRANRRLKDVIEEAEQTFLVMVCSNRLAGAIGLPANTGH